MSVISQDADLLYNWSLTIYSVYCYYTIVNQEKSVIMNWHSDYGVKIVNIIIHYAAHVINNKNDKS